MRRPWFGTARPAAAQAIRKRPGASRCVEDGLRVGCRRVRWNRGSHRPRQWRPQRWYRRQGDCEHRQSPVIYTPTPANGSNRVRTEALPANGTYSGATGDAQRAASQQRALK
jgi:hypothetical protein